MEVLRRGETLSNKRKFNKRKFEEVLRRGETVSNKRKFNKRKFNKPKFNKRKFEVEVEPELECVRTRPSVESNKLDDSVITKEECQLEVEPELECVRTRPSVESNKSDVSVITKEECQLEVLHAPTPEESSGEEHEWVPSDREEVYKDKLTLDSIIIKKFREDDGILLSAKRTRVKRAKDEIEGGKEEIFGADIIGEWFHEYPYPSPSAFLSKLKLDGETLKSLLHDSMFTLDGTPDWDELAKYVKQLKESDEGFDLDEYKNLAGFTDGLPVRLPDKELHCWGEQLEECMAAALKLYEEAGGGKLEEEKLVKANAEWGSSRDTYYITFRAKSCLDGKEREYQAEVVYDGVYLNGVDEGEMMVRLKKDL